MTRSFRRIPTQNFTKRLPHETKSMRKQELSAWTLMIAAALVGSVATATLSGCKPPAAPEVDTSTDEISVDLGNTTSQVGSVTSGSNVTASDSGNVTTSWSPVVETPVAESDSTTADTDSVTDSESATKTETTLVSTAATSVQDVLQAGGDWPQWGGTRERNNVPNVKNLPIEWNIGKFDRRTGEWDNEKALNIRWYANLGSQTYGNPVIADGRVFVGTNNGAGQHGPLSIEDRLGLFIGIRRGIG